jgi:exosortase/archaeosortase family protein
VRAETVTADLQSTRRAQLRFVLRFAPTAGVLLAAYYFPYAQEGRAKALINGFLHAYAASAALVLRAFDPSVRVAGQEIIGAFAMRIVQTCDAMDVTILLVSAIVSWKAPIGRRFVAALVGVLALGILNLLRICSLYLIGMTRPSLLEAAHLDVWPVIFLAVTVGFFLTFASFEQRRAQAGAPR